MNHILRAIGLLLGGWLAAGFCLSQPAEQDYRVVRVASGLDRPVYALSPPGDGDRLFILEQKTGRVRILDLAQGQLAATPFATIGVAVAGNEQGLLGMAFHPDYAQNGWFFVNYTRPADGATVISRWQVSDEDPNRVDPGSERVLLTVAQPFSNHNGGWLGFGPDGFLYAAMGDGGGPPLNRAQDRSTLYGAILRLDADQVSAPYYQAPQDNPFAEEAGGALIWAYGLRNPWRCSFDRLTGDLYIADVGQDAWEEINFQPAGLGGQNYGWQVFEGSACYLNNQACGNAGFVEPLYAYPHDDSTLGGESVTGGYVYRGPAASLRGVYVFADFLSGRIWGVRHDGATVTELLDLTDSFQPEQGALSLISSFGEDAFGNLYITDLGGDVFKLESTRDAAVDLVGPAAGEVGEPLVFRAVSNDEGDPVESSLWDMGDGVELAILGGALEYAYKQPGTYAVSVNATLSSGAAAEAQTEVAVADFAPDEPLAGLTVQFEGADAALLQWHGGSDASVRLLRYEVYAQRDGGPRELLASSWGGSYTAKGLTPGADYVFSVETVYEDGVAGETIQTAATAPNVDASAKRHHLRFPHVVENEQWWTGVVIVNAGDEPADISLRVLGQLGNVITDQGTLTRLEPGEKSIGLGYQYFDQEIFIPNVWFDLASTSKLVGFELFGQGFGVMSGLEVSGRLLRRGFLPVGRAGGDRYVGISMVNASEDQACNLRVKGFGEDGALLSENTVAIPPLGKVLRVVQDLFGEAWRENVETVMWEADQFVTGFELWGDLNWSRQSGMLTANSGAVRNFLPLVEPGGAILLQNTAAAANEVELLAYDDSGQLRQKQTYALPAYAQLSLSADAVAPNFSGSVTLISSGALNAVSELQRVRKEEERFSEAVPAQSQTGSEFLYPHVASNEQWTTEIILVNTGEDADTATIEAYDGLGRFVARETRDIPGRGRLHAEARALFDDASSIAYLRVTTNQPDFVGHLIYYSNDGWGHVMGGAPTPPL